MRDFASVQTDTWMRQRAAECCLALVLSPAFAWICPFGVDEQVFLARLGYWAGVLACWFLAMAITERLFEARGILRPFVPPFRWLAAAGVSALPMLVIVSPATHVLTGWTPSPENFLELYCQVVLLGAGVSMIGRSALGLHFDVTVDATASATAAPADLQPVAVDAAAAYRPEPQAATNPLVARLPVNLRGRMIALEMEDHYARVHTDRGSGLVLLRLGDAIAESAPTAGRRVHRSWWVADDAIQHCERVGRVGRLRLSNGLSAPVSQRYLKEIDVFLSKRGEDRLPAAPPAVQP